MAHDRLTTTLESLQTLYSYEIHNVIINSYIAIIYRHILGSYTERFTVLHIYYAYWISDNTYYMYIHVTA